MGGMYHCTVALFGRFFPSPPPPLSCCASLENSLFVFGRECEIALFKLSFISCVFNELLILSRKKCGLCL